MHDKLFYMAQGDRLKSLSVLGPCPDRNLQLRIRLGFPRAGLRNLEYSRIMTTRPLGR